MVFKKTVDEQSPDKIKAELQKIITEIDSTFYEELQKYADENQIYFIPEAVEDILLRHLTK